MKIATVVWVVLALVAVLLLVVLWWSLRRRNGSSQVHADARQAQADLAASGWAQPHAPTPPAAPYAPPAAPYAPPPAPGAAYPQQWAQPSQSPFAPPPAPVADPSSSTAPSWPSAAAAAGAGAGVVGAAAGSVFARPDEAVSGVQGAEYAAPPRVDNGAETNPGASPWAATEEDIAEEVVAEEVIAEEVIAEEVIAEEGVPAVSQELFGGQDGVDDGFPTEVTPDVMTEVEPSATATEDAIDESGGVADSSQEAEADPDLATDESVVAQEPLTEATGADPEVSDVDLWTPTEGPVRPSIADEAAAAARARIEGETGVPASVLPVSEADHEEDVADGAGEVDLAPQVATVADVADGAGAGIGTEEATEEPFEDAGVAHAGEAGSDAAAADLALEQSLDADEAALGGSPEVDAAEAAYDAAEVEAAESAPEGSAWLPAAGAGASGVLAAVASSAEDGEPTPTREAAEEILEADEVAMTGDPDTDEAEARFQAELAAMTAERDALADGIGDDDGESDAGEPTDAGVDDGESDAGEPIDAGVDDGESDAGEPMDAGVDDGESDADIEASGHVAPTAPTAPTAPPRRRWVSEYDEVVDGGYGWGSAAPVWDGAMPLGHPVKANREWMKFQEPADGWYDQMQADVWFIDAETAHRFGFTKD